MKEEEHIWKFKTGNKRYSFCYVKEAMRHPAKMEIDMCRKIIKTYSKQGDLILDCMAGIFTTGIEGSLLGRNVIGIEYEQKFCDLAQKNLEQTNKQMGFMKRGNAIILKGDARDIIGTFKANEDKLKGIHGIVDSVVFSPPFAAIEKAHDKEWYNKNIPRPSNDTEGYSNNPDNIGNQKYGEIDSVIMSPPFMQDNKGRGINSDIKAGIERQNQTKHVLELSESSDNIDNIKTYNPSERESEKKNYITEMLRVYKQCFLVLKNGKKWCECEHLNSNGVLNMSNENHINGIYSRNNGRGRKYPSKEGEESPSCKYNDRTESNKTNSNETDLETNKELENSSTLLSASEGLYVNNSDIQPRGHQEISGDNSSLSDVQERGSNQCNKIHRHTSMEETPSQSDTNKESNKDVSKLLFNGGDSKTSSLQTSTNQENSTRSQSSNQGQGISNQSFETCEKCGENKRPQDYWESPQKYDCGFMILVLKNFIRKGKEIRLDLDTIKLAEACGFKHIAGPNKDYPARHRRFISNPSFWVQNYRKKNKNAIIIDYEDILVFVKTEAQ